MEHRVYFLIFTYPTGIHLWKKYRWWSAALVAEWCSGVLDNLSDRCDGTRPCSMYCITGRPRACLCSPTTFLCPETRWYVSLQVASWRCR